MVRERRQLTVLGQSAVQFGREGQDLMIRPVIKVDAFDRAGRIAVENGCAGDILILKLALPFQAGSRTGIHFMNKAEHVVHCARGVEKVPQRGRTANWTVGDGYRESRRP